MAVDACGIAASSLAKRWIELGKQLGGDKRRRGHDDRVGWERLAVGQANVVAVTSGQHGDRRRTRANLDAAGSEPASPAS